jgi:hypothetical protein
MNLPGSGSPSVARKTAFGGLPNGIHIPIVVYGEAFTRLFVDVTMRNLASLVREIPDDLRSTSVVRILTTAVDMPRIETSAALSLLKAAIRVEVSPAVHLAGFDRHGDYGPMVLTFESAVRAASAVGAALFFVGSDQIYSTGAFAMFVERLRQGYRIAVGAGLRIKRDAAKSVLEQKILADPDGCLRLTPEETIDALFRFWHPINDQYTLNAVTGIPWKALVCVRPTPGNVLIRFFQGPTLMAWPRRPLPDFNGFIDHSLVQHCCRSWREAYVVSDARECLALDLTDDRRRDVQPVSDLPQLDLLRELFDSRGVNDIQLRYGLRTCEIHLPGANSTEIETWRRQLSRLIDPLILMAVCERRLRRWLGPMGAPATLCFRIAAQCAMHTLSLLLWPITRIVFRNRVVPT